MPDKEWMISLIDEVFDRLGSLRTAMMIVDEDFDIFKDENCWIGAMKAIRRIIIKEIENKE